VIRFAVEVDADAISFLLGELVVHPGLRGKGIGRRLVAVAERFARDCGCERLELTSGAHRHDAHRFYTTLGFSPRPVRFVKDLG
jgi:GNAT superfamily N-acetyltransferase